MITDRPAGAFIQVRGIVQGVGFRPFIYALALRHHLTGWVRNTSSGVEIQASGSEIDLHAFLAAIEREKPPLAQIDALEVTLSEPGKEHDFQIRSSQAVEGQFMPSFAGYEHLRGLPARTFRPGRPPLPLPFHQLHQLRPALHDCHRYPLRPPQNYDGWLSAVPGLPREYENPLDRRFHAQPVACPTCGPQLWFDGRRKNPGARRGCSADGAQLAEGGKIWRSKGWAATTWPATPSNPAGGGNAAETQETQRQSRSP